MTPRYQLKFRLSADVSSRNAAVFLLKLNLRMPAFFLYLIYHHAENPVKSPIDVKVDVDSDNDKIRVYSHGRKIMDLIQISFIIIIVIMSRRLLLHCLNFSAVPLKFMK